MTEDQKPIDPVEAARLEVEQLRLELERARLQLDRERHQDETIRTYLEQWRTEVNPIREGAERSREMAFGFAKMALQIMFLLNGGALIAFPAFAKLVGAAFTDHITFALLSIAGFVVGLVFIAVATLCAFWAMDADKQTIFYREELVKIDLNRQRNSEDFSDDEQKRRGEVERARSIHYSRAARMRAISAGLGIASAVTFVAGAIFAAVVLSGASNPTAKKQGARLTRTGVVSIYEMPKRAKLTNGEGMFFFIAGGDLSVRLVRTL